MQTLLLLLQFVVLLLQLLLPLHVMLVVFVLLFFLSYTTLTLPPRTWILTHLGGARKHHAFAVVPTWPQLFSYFPRGRPSWRNLAIRDDLGANQPCCQSFWAFQAAFLLISSLFSLLAGFSLCSRCFFLLFSLLPSLAAARCGKVQTLLLLLLFVVLLLQLPLPLHVMLVVFVLHFFCPTQR